MSYSKQVAFPNYEKLSAIQADDSLKLLEKSLLDTIPDKSNARQWLQLEQGCIQLFGEAITHVRTGKDVAGAEINNFDQFDAMWLPLMCHNQQELENYKAFFVDAEIFTVLVDGDPKFIDLAIRKKWPNDHHCIDLDAYKLFKEEMVSVDFDFCFPNWNPLILENHNMIKHLACNIGIKFDINLSNNYIKKYVDFHL